MSSIRCEETLKDEKRPTIASVETHTMGASLHKYLQMKVHCDIQQNVYRSIHVIGQHSRLPPTRTASVEKNDKPFNWQRPTAIDHGDGSLTLMCFPGPGYVQHYAAIIATYLHLQGQDPSIVTYTLPSQDECMAPLLKSNLRAMGNVDTVVLGYVHGLERYVTSGKWVGGGSDQLFAWQKYHAPDGTTVAFLGCRVSFWGDIAGNVVRALQQLNQTKTVLYIGKLGTLLPEIPPNKFLATGCTSLVNGAQVTWENVLEKHIARPDRVIHGAHYSLPSVLDETKQWLEARMGIFDFVDPEIGHMALASNAGGTGFGYLHIISDNIARKYEYDLSNERVEQVLRDREMLIAAIGDTLQRFFESA